MSVGTTSFFDTNPNNIARFFDEILSGSKTWTPNEMKAILRHQLAASPGFDVRGTSRDGLSSAQNSLKWRSYRELFEHPDPPIELLRSVKSFAKGCRAADRGPLPKDIASMLYYAAIAAALIHCFQRISNLPPAGLRKGFKWALRQPWIDDGLRPLFREALETMETA